MVVVVVVFESSVAATTTATAATATAATAKPADEPAAKKAADPAQKKFESVNGLWQEFKDGKTAADITKEYKLTKRQLNDFMVELYARLEVTDFIISKDEILETTKFFKMHKDDITQVSLRSIIFAKGVSVRDYEKAITDSFFKTTTSGIIDLYTDTPSGKEITGLHLIVGGQAETLAGIKNIGVFEETIKMFKQKLYGRR